MDALRHDLRYAFRALLNRPWFSTLAILTLAIGIGVNTVAFSAMNALFRKPMRFDGARELGWIQTTGGASPYHHTSLPDYLDLRRDNRTFAAIIAEARLPLSMRAAGSDGLPGGGASEQAWGLLVSANYLSTLRARPVLGRLLTEGDGRGSELPAVASERFWRERLGGGDSVAGVTVSLNGQIFSIVGVLPEGFQGPGGLYEPDVWLPLERLDVLNLSPALTTRGHGWLSVAGRRDPGTTAAQAQADLRGVMAQLALAHPATNTGRSVTFTPVTDGVPDLRRIQRLAWLGLAVVGIVLVIACFNVAGLLLARASERQREIGVRAALGASRARILRQLLTEGCVLAALSGAAALMVAIWSADLLSAFSLPSPIPQQLHIPMDRRLFAFTLGLVAIAGVVPALIPALQCSRLDLSAVIRRETGLGGSGSRVRNLFVMAQVAGSTLFLAAALLFLQSFWNSSRFAPGYDIAHTLVLELDPSAYGRDEMQSRQFFEQLVERIRQVPGIQDAALTDRAPFSIGAPKTVDVAADAADCAVTTCRSALEFGVSPGHFAAFGLPLKAGRELNEQEYRSEAPVVLVTETVAAALWPRGDAVGSSIRVGKRGRLVTVIGIVADVKDLSSGGAARWCIYRPLHHAEFGGRVAVVMRAAGDPAPLIPLVEEEVRALDPILPGGGVRTTRERMELPLWPARTGARFLVVCGTLALILAAAGLFGVTYYTVSQRTREFGVRIALGATSGNVMSLVLRESLTLTIPGVGLGIVAALLAVRLVARWLIGIGPSDASTYAAAAALQAVVAVAACALPAYRATRVDPMFALRQE